MTTRRHYLPFADTLPAQPRRHLGLDQQGRFPQAADSADDIGVSTDDLASAQGIVFAVCVALVIWFIVIMAALAVWWPV